MITPSDLVDPIRKSGYRYVVSAGSAGHGGGKPWRAERGAKQKGNYASVWKGPRRATALEAAQDYCDYINSGKATVTPRLKSAGHKAAAREKIDDGLTKIEREVLGKLQAKQRDGIQKARKNKTGYIYLIGEQKKGGSGAVNGLLFLNGRFFDSFAVKIGYSDESPERRIKQLQTGNPRPLVLLGHIRGTLKDEAKLHQQFIHHNILQEWFRPTPALLSIFRKKEAEHATSTDNAA